MERNSGTYKGLNRPLVLGRERENWRENATTLHFSILLKSCYREQDQNQKSSFVTVFFLSYILHLQHLNDYKNCNTMQLVKADFAYMVSCFLLYTFDGKS